MREQRPMQERLAEFQALRDSGLGVKAAARRMGVSGRSGRLYALRLRQSSGLPSPGVAARLRAPLLAVLRARPDDWFTAGDLAAYVRHSARCLSTKWGVLPRLVAEGLAEVQVGVRDPGKDHRPVRRYRLAAASRNETEHNGTEANG